MPDRMMIDLTLPPFISARPPHREPRPENLCHFKARVNEGKLIRG